MSNEISISRLTSIPPEQIVGNNANCCYGETVEQGSFRYDLEEIDNIRKKRIADKKQLYDRILCDCTRRMKNDTIIGKSNAVIMIDKIIVGHPNYNYDECIKYITTQLSKYGVITEIINDNKISISWEKLKI